MSPWPPSSASACRRRCILAGTALLIQLTLAFLLGVYAAVRKYSLFDTIFTVVTYVGFALPTFILGLLLIFAFTQEPLKLFPVGGMWDTRTIPPFGTSDWWTMLGAQPLKVLADLGGHLVLPVITLVTVSVAGDSRFIRASMLDALDQDYVKTAKAKGVAPRGVVYRHALRNALLPVITNIGLEIPLLFTGAIVTETIFSWPGMGRLSIESTNAFDYPVLMGILGHHRDHHGGRQHPGRHRLRGGRPPRPLRLKPDATPRPVRSERARPIPPDPLAITLAASRAGRPRTSGG